MQMLAELLTGILSAHTADVFTLASASGKLPTLAGAFEHVLYSTGLFDATLLSGYLKSEILSYDRLHLSEHHLYGSSRLGIQRYLPSQYSYTAASTEGGNYDGLLESRSWYSRYANDLFGASVLSNALLNYNLSLANMPLHNHILGNRQFELTNHLGNVQATVLDRTNPRLGTPVGNSAPITGYVANIATAQDYFPFGMYMPGRYISDTATHCITLSKRIMVQRFIPFKYFPWPFGTLTGHVFRYGDPAPVPEVYDLPKATLATGEKPFVFHMLPASQHTGGLVLKALAGPDTTTIYKIDLGGEPAPVYSYLHLHPDTALTTQSLSVTVNYSPGTMVEARIRQYISAGQPAYSTPQAWQVIPNGQPYTIGFSTDPAAIAAGGATLLEYRTTKLGAGAFPALTEVAFTATAVTVSEYEPRDVLVTICDEKDNYRFGFNGQEKVNEVAGIGNWNTTEFWEYNTRTGIRANPDPKPVPWESVYCVNGANPIFYRDPLGDFKSKFGAQVYKFFHGGDIRKATEGEHSGEWYVGRDAKYTGSGAGVAYQRNFSWGRVGKASDAASDFYNSYDFYYNDEAKVTLGVQGGAEVNIAGKKVGVEANLFSVEVVSAKKEKTGWNNDVVPSLDYYGKDHWVKFSQGVKLGAGVVSGSLEHEWRNGAEGGPMYDRVLKKEFAAGLLGPLGTAYSRETPLGGMSSTPQIQRVTDKATINFGVGIKALLGIEYKLEIGFKRK